MKNLPFGTAGRAGLLLASLPATLLAFIGCGAYYLITSLVMPVPAA